MENLPNLFPPEKRHALLQRYGADRPGLRDHLRRTVLTSFDATLSRISIELADVSDKDWGQVELYLRIEEEIIASPLEKCRRKLSHGCSSAS